MNLKTEKEAAIIIMKIVGAQTCLLLQDLLKLDFKDRGMRIIFVGNSWKVVSIIEVSRPLGCGF